MIEAYKEHIQFIFILIVMYVLGVWVAPAIYVVFPLVILLFITKEKTFELFIVTLWMLILSDYVPVENATYDDLQFAKTLKPILPIALFISFIIKRHEFRPFSKVFLYFLPFLISVTISLNYSLLINVGIQKTISFVLIYLMIPIFTLHLHNKYQDLFWRSLITFIIGMLMIGIALKFVAPDIGMLAGGRFKGILGNPNGLGVFLFLTFVLWTVINEFKLASFTKHEKKLVVFVILLSLFWCGSRNAIMSILLFYTVYRISKIHWSLAILSVAIILIFSDLFFIVFVEIVEFLGLEDYFRIDSIEEGSGRKVAWLFAWTQIQDYFLIGGGFGHDEHIMRPNYRWLSFEGHQGGVHNSYLSLWFDAGIIGVFLYFSGLITIIFQSFKESYLLLAFSVGLFFNITYESWLVASLNPFTIVYLVILTIFVSKIASPQPDDSLKIENEAQ